MALKIGSTSIGSLYLGSTKIGQAYLGNVKVYESAVQLPAYTLRYKFYTSGFDPTTITGGKGTWTQVSSSPNVWDWTYNIAPYITDWTYGPFANSTSSASTVHLTGLYDIIAAGDNTRVADISYFFGIYGTENPTGCTTNGPVNVCDLHVRPSGVASLFRWCPTLEYFAGNIDISRCYSFAGMYSHTSITMIPPFTGMNIFTAGLEGATGVSFKYFANDCQYLTSASNLNTLDLRYDDLSAMGVNDGLIFDSAFTGTPNLAFTGHETDSWNANAIPIRIFGSSSSTSPTDIALSSNKVNLFQWRIRNACQFKYLFSGAGLTTVPDFTAFNYTNCDFTGCFSNNVDVTSGALAAYTKLSSLSATVGTDCFLDCGSNTVAGQADLDQIPQSWGGNLVVQDYYLGTSWSKWKNSTTYGTIWGFTSNIDYSVLTSMQIYTESSVSSYAGVNMRKTNVKNIKGTFVASGSDCYYWPCICQFDSNFNVTWYLRTQNYNGMLTSAQSSGDMPGTLSAATLGTASVSGGTFDANTDVKFCFMVTNTSDASDIIANHGILYNSNFYADPVIRVVTSTLNPAAAYIGA